jgi:iron complex transport system ATP-binding protein
MKSCLDIRDLSIGYSSSKALVEAVNLTINEGETIALLGLNGCGKSTFLKTIIGELKALNGRIQIEGKELSSYSSRDLAKKIATVNTHYQNPGQITVEELVSYGRYPYTTRLHLLETTDIEAIEKSMLAIDILHLRDKFVEELSDGERQKVMLACAIAQNTPILLLDEPSSHLDVRNKVVMMNLIRKFALEEKKCILFSTHDLALARKVASRIWLIHDHSILDEKTEDFIKNKSWKSLMEGLDDDMLDWL